MGKRQAFSGQNPYHPSFQRRGPSSRFMPTEKPRQFRASMRRLWTFFMTEQRLFTIVIVMTLGVSCIELAAPYLLGRAIDAMSATGTLVNFSLLGIIVAVLATAYLADGTLNLLRGWIMAGISQRIVRTLRKSLFDKLQKLPVSFFDGKTHGDLMSRISNDIDNLSTTIGQSTTQLFSNIIMIAGSIVMMVILSPLLALASLITVPLLLLLTRTIASKTRRLFLEQQNTLGKLNGHIEETVSGLQVVKVFGHEHDSIFDFDAVNSRLRDVSIRAQIWAGFLMPIMNVIGNLGFAILAGLGGLLAVNNMITIGVIASFLSYSRQFARPLNEIANIFNTLQAALAGAERVFEVLDETEEPADPPDAVELSGVRGYVSFEKVSFAYVAGNPVLHNVSLDAKPGSSMALVGPTGAGKTTLVNLLSRFYEPSSGTILIDGKDIRRYTRSSLRRSFGIVLQDTYLFS
ncbi:MAG: ABC transporter ATP-binding protein, partial [Spirochaetales bacterium]|nr:ABC transporter ATP-binding protein [Spirochaetales bacterium]